jgi:hypothetical protein
MTSQKDPGFAVAICTIPSPDEAISNMMKPRKASRERRRLVVVVGSMAHHSTPQPPFGYLDRCRY